MFWWCVQPVPWMSQLTGLYPLSYLLTVAVMIKGNSSIWVAWGEELVNYWEIKGDVIRLTRQHWPMGRENGIINTRPPTLRHTPLPGYPPSPYTLYYASSVLPPLLPHVSPYRSQRSSYHGDRWPPSGGSPVTTTGRHVTCPLTIWSLITWPTRVGQLVFNRVMKAT